MTHRFPPLIVLSLLCGCAAVQPEPAAPGLNVGRAALASGAPDIALQISAAKLSHSPNDVAALELQGDAYATEGLVQAAASSFDRALALAPGSPEALLGLGRLDLATAPSQAELLFLEVIASDPRNAVALNDLGIARDLQGRHAQAQTAYAQALGVAPAMQAAIVNLALSLALSGQADRARDLLAPLAEAPGASTRVRHDFALVSEAAGDRPVAEEMLQPDMSQDDLQAALKGYDALSGRSGFAGSP
jgi:Flp pilus assembly protein TadD